MMPYDEFKARVVQALRAAGRPLTWTEVRTSAGLPQSFPNNQWVHRLEQDAGLYRHRTNNGIIHWELKKGSGVDLFESQAAKAADKDGTPPGRK